MLRGRLFTNRLPRQHRSQAAYQNRVINAKREANGQLQNNLTASKALVKIIPEGFLNTPKILQGATTAGSGDRDGDNGKIILDALPSQYDFPALATSLEKIAWEPHGC